VLIAAVAAERGVEMLISRRNARRAFARGGIEVGAGHFGLMVLLHSLFLMACVAEVALLERPWRPWLGWPALALVAASMGLRYWVIATLGERWNTRVILVPGSAAVSSGPFRYVRHPNYLAVVVELAALPLVHGAWLTAVGFGLANAALLRRRIRVEEQALMEHCGYGDVFSDKPRFLPGRS
jgi:methyltransferase